MLHKMSKMAVILLMLLLTACRSTTPILVQVSQSGDHFMSCDAILTEMAEMKDRIRDQEQEQTFKIAANIALVAASFIIFYNVSSFIYYLSAPIPLMFTDLSDGTQAEIKSASDRYERLQRISNEKWCAVKG